MAHTRHDRLVRRARNRLTLLPDVRYRKRVARGAVAAIDTTDTDRRHALHPSPRNQRQTVNGSFLAARQGEIDTLDNLRQCKPKLTPLVRTPSSRLPESGGGRRLAHE